MNEHSHEMTRFRNRIAVWSSLHEPVLIYGSSHGSVFESPLYRVHNEHESRSGPGLLQLVRISPNGSEMLIMWWFTAHRRRLWRDHRGPRGCRWIEEFAVKGVGAFALVDGDPRRSTESRKTARSKISPTQ